MNTNASKIYMLESIICAVLLLATCAFAQNPGFSSALCVVISAAPDPVAQDIGFSKDRLASKIELTLRKNGIPVSTGSIDAVTLSCTVFSFYPTIGGIAGVLELRAYQAVQPGISDIWMNADTWNSGIYCAVSESESSLRSNILQNLDAMLDKFSNEWLKSKQPK